MITSLKTTFLIHAIISLAFGIMAYLISGTWATTVNWMPFDPTTTRLYGTALIGIGVSSLLAFRVTRWEEVRIIVQMEIVYTVLGALISLYAALITGAPCRASLGLAGLSNCATIVQSPAAIVSL